MKADIQGSLRAHSVLRPGCAHAMSCSEEPAVRDTPYHTGDTEVH